MLPLVEFPKLVQEYAPYFASVFSPEAFIEFERYISGLLVSENKTVDGINRLFILESRNQSSLNRLLTASSFSLAEVNNRRLGVLDRQPETQIKRTGVASVDDTLLIHYGQHFEQIAQLWDPDGKRYVWAHDLVSLHYSDDDTDYPLLFRLWKPANVEELEAGFKSLGIPLRESKQVLKTENPRKWRHYLQYVWRDHQDQPGVTDLYQSKLVIAEQLLTEWVQAHPTFHCPITFDNWYTEPGFCHYLEDQLHLNYVGTLAPHDHVVLKRGKLRLDEFAEQLKKEHLMAVHRGGAAVFKPITIPYKGAKERYYSYCQTHRLHRFNKQRLVINYTQADLSDTPRFFISNRLSWQAPGITRIRRHRWPVDVFYEEGKAEGLDQYQVRDFQAIEKHIGLVAVIYSLLRAAQHDPHLRDKLQRQLKLDLDGSPAFWRRVSQTHCLWSLAAFIAAGLAKGQSLPTILAPLVRALCAV